CSTSLRSRPAMARPTSLSASGAQGRELTGTSQSEKTSRGSPPRSRQSVRCVALTLAPSLIPVSHVAFCRCAFRGRCEVQSDGGIMKKSLVMSLLLLAVTNWLTDSSPAGNQYVLVPIPASAGHHAVQGKPRLRNANGTSQNWSGYAAETSLSSPQDGAVTDVKGSWIVPAVTASSSSKTYSSAWLGIDGYSDGTVEQIVTEQDWSN